MQKRAARRGVRALAFLLCLLMVVSLLPVMGANAAEGGNTVVNPPDENQDTGLVLNKTLTESSNGDYWLVLEAYATGTVTSNTTTTPTDVVLLLDVSGSMSNKISNRDNTTRIAALKTAAKSFIDATAAKNAVITDPAQQHRISIVKFAGTEKQTVGNDTYYYSYQSPNYNYTQIVTELTTVDDSGKETLKDSIDALNVSGTTAADYGLNRAEAALQNNGEGRAKVIVLFTDGEPNHKIDFDESVAADAVNKAKTLKDAGTTIFTVSVLDSSDPTQNPTGNRATNMNKYMQAVSSNYPEATAKSDRSGWTVTFNTGNYQAGYYKKASSAAELSSIFTEISNSVGGTTVTLDGNAVLRDIISSDFTLPEGFNASSVTVQTADYQGNGKFAAPVPAASGITASVNGSIVDVTGFSYKDHYVVDASSDGQVKAGGQKLIVTINGLIPVDSRGTDVATYSNTEASGIYTAASDTEPFVPFSRPYTYIPVHTKVLDFSMTANIATAVQQTSGKLAGTYGTFTANSGDLTYKLGKSVKDGNLVFDGVDSVLFYGNYNADNDELSRWNKVNVIPANNVYFDDDLLKEQSTFTDGDYGYDKKVPTTTETVDNLNSDTQVNKTTSFTFKGTRIDVYCTTEASSGAIVAKLYDAEHKLINGILMDNKYQSGTLYNVPTISFGDLEYGEYTLVIGANNGSNYKLDGVRVYHPADETNETVQSAYAADDESSAVFTQVRKLLLDTTSDTLMADGNVLGVVYTDATRGDGQTHDTNVVGTYKDLGPKNEVYLAKNNGIAFQIPNYNGQKVMVGLSAPDSENHTGIVSVPAGDNATTNINVVSAVDMYYEVTPTTQGYVFIKNTGDALISVTNVKVSGTGASSASFEVGPQLMSYVASFDTLNVVQPEPEPTPDPEPTVNNNTVSAIIRAIWAQVMDGIGKLFGRL